MPIILSCMARSGTSTLPDLEDVLTDYLRGSDEYEQIVIIGDSPSDMRLKRVAGGVTYLYAHPDFAFRNCEADHRIRDLRKVLEHLK